MTLATRRAIERSGGHLYTFREGETVMGPFPGATAICALQDSLGGSDGLLRWGVNLAVDAYERVLNETKDWDAAKAAAIEAKDGPANLGTAIHAAADRFNRNLPLGLTIATAPYIAQYGAAIYREGITVLSSERYAVEPQIGFGGAYDSLVEIGGERGPLDVKSGREKPSQRLQLTGLSMCQWHAEAGLEAEPMPEMTGVGFILLLRPDGYELVRHEITDADREHFIRLVKTYHEIRGWAADYMPTVVKEEKAA